MSQALPMLDHGTMLVARSRQLVAEAAATVNRSRRLRAELAAMLQAGQNGTGLGQIDVGAQITTCAEQLIDVHGRWARHVALACAAKRACAEDRRSEGFWQGVMAEIIDIQVTPG